MIENVRKKRELMKLSDKFPQPFEASSTRDCVIKFNGKLQKKTKSKKRK